MAIKVVNYETAVYSSLSVFGDHDQPVAKIHITCESNHNEFELDLLFMPEKYNLDLPSPSFLYTLIDRRNATLALSWRQLPLVLDQLRNEKEVSLFEELTTVPTNIMNVNARIVNYVGIGSHFEEIGEEEHE